MSGQQVRITISGDGAGAVKAAQAVTQSLDRLKAQGTTGLAAVQASTQQADQALTQMGNHLAAMGHTAASALALGKLAVAGDAWVSLTTRIKIASDGLGPAAAAQQRLFEIAQATRSPIDDLATIYQRMAGAGKELGMSQSAVLDVTQTLSQAMALNGGSAESASAALLQFGQGLASGALRGDELNSVLEQAPRLAQALADGLGITTGEMRKLAEQGKLTPDALMQALQRASGGIRAEFAQLPTTISGALTQVQNAFMRTVGVMSADGGLGSAAAGGFKALADHMGGVVTVAELLLAVMGGRMVGAMATSATALLGAGSAARALAIAEVEAATAAEADALADLNAARARAALTLATDGVTLATERYAAAQAATAAATAGAAAAGGLAARAVGLLGGPVGALATLLITGAGLWMAWGSKATEGAKAANEGTKESDDQIIDRLTKQVDLLRQRETLQAAAKVGQTARADVGDAGAAYARIEGQRQRLLAGSASAAEGGTLTGAARESLIGQLTQQAAVAFQVYSALASAAVDKQEKISEALLTDVRQTASTDIDLRRTWLAEAVKIAETYTTEIDRAAGNPERQAALVRERDQRLIEGQRQTNEKIKALGIAQTADARALAVARADTQIALDRQTAEKVLQRTESGLAAVEAARAADVISLGQYNARKARLEEEALQAKVTLAEAELRAEQAKPTDGTPAAEQQKAAKLIDLQTKVGDARAALSLRVQKAASDDANAELAAARLQMQQLGDAQAAVADLTKSINEANASARIELIADPAVQEVERTRQAIDKLQKATDKAIAPLQAALANDSLPANVRAAYEAQINALQASTSQGIELANAGLAERMKPEWQRMLEAWQDTNRQLRDTYDQTMSDVLKTGEDAFVQLQKTGRVSLTSMLDTVSADLARNTYRTSIAPALQQGASTLMGWLGMARPAADTSVKGYSGTEGDANFMGPIADASQQLTDGSKSLGDVAKSFLAPITGLGDAGAQLVQSALGWLIPQTAQTTAAVTAGSAAMSLTMAATALMSSAAALEAAAATSSATSAGGDLASMAAMFAADGAMISGAGWSPAAAFAAGGAFGGGEVLNQPTLFRYMQHGAVRMGIAGEAGPEAALPLRGGGVSASLDGHAMGALPLRRVGGILGVDVSALIADYQQGQVRRFATGGAFGTSEQATAAGGAPNAAGDWVVAGEVPVAQAITMHQTLVFHGNGVSRAEMATWAQQIKKSTLAEVDNAMARGRKGVR